MAEHRKAIQILKRGKNKHFELDKSGLQTALDNAEGHPISIVTICGSKKSGKSFMLNVFLHLQIKGMPDKGWKSYLPFKPEKLKTMFGCNYGVRTDSEGIWILDKPFIFDASNGKIALYLMDVQQGTLDQTSKKESIQIITLATLMSSHLILNFTGQIQVAYSENFKFLKEVSSYLHRGSPKPILQEMYFFIRDDSSKENMSKETEVPGFGTLATRTRLTKFPTPNVSVIERNEKETQPIEIRVIGDNFLQHVDTVFNDIKQYARPVHLNGVKVNDQQIYDHILNCCKHLLTDQDLSAVKLGKSVATSHLERLLEEKATYYEATMTKTLEDCTHGLFYCHQNHKRLEQKILQAFNEAKMGSKDLVGEYRKELIDTINHIYNVLSCAHAQQKLINKDVQNQSEALEARNAQLTTENDHLKQRLSAEMGEKQHKIHQLTAEAKQNEQKILEMTIDLKQKDQKVQQLTLEVKRNEEKHRRILEEKEVLAKIFEILAKHGKQIDYMKCNQSETGKQME